MKTFELAPGYVISRVIRGGWQLAGGHGAIDREAAVADLRAGFEAGITAYDCADIYTGVEELMGAFRASLLPADRPRLKIHTKFVPDLSELATISRDYVRSIVDRSLQRLGVERIDLLQFHWWDYGIPRFVETALWLCDLQREGKIDLLGGTNFDGASIRAMRDGGAPMRSMQVQYSLLDRRPRQLEPLGVPLLCYGTVAGGFLSEKWLGQPEPVGAAENRSLTKYKLVIDEFGGWDLFQSLLQALDGIAKRHDSDIASIASRFVLEQKGVAAIIVGARNAAHVIANARICDLVLDPADIAEIEILLRQATDLPGDVFTLERDRTGRHGAIMKYELNK